VTAERAEIAIIGGGPAGAAAAVRLAHAGCDVLLIERSRTTMHKLCGEFVSCEALAALDGLGIKLPTAGVVPLAAIRLTAGNIVAEARLPFPTAGLSRRLLDMLLLREAVRAGVRIRRGVAVRKVEAGKGSAAIHLADGTTFDAAEAILATGKHDIAPRARETRWPGRGSMLGLKMHLRLSPEAASRLGPAVELHLFPGGCAGLQPVGNGVVNLCITLDRNEFARAGHDFRSFLDHIGNGNAAFRAAINDASMLWPRPLAIARVPYGHLRGPQELPDHLWPVGDQAAVTASFTGDGIALALASGIAAAEELLAGGSSASYLRAFRCRARRQMRCAMALQRLIDYPSLHHPLVALARRQPWMIRKAASLTRLPRAAGSDSATERWRKPEAAEARPEPGGT